jgi:hypothetical protein
MPIVSQAPTSAPADKTTLIVKFAQPLQAGSVDHAAGRALASGRGRDQLATEKLIEGRPTPLCRRWLA